jgi:hypothetical protein
MVQSMITAESDPIYLILAHPEIDSFPDIVSVQEIESRV